MSKWIPRLTRRTVIVHTKDDKSIRGNLAGAYTDSLVLKDGRYLQGEGPGLEVDGDIVIPRENVSWVQHLIAPTDLEGMR